MPKVVHCDEHGESLPTFVCSHLPGASGLGFHHSDEPDGEDDIETGRPDAWCGACEQRRQAHGGEWTDESEPEVVLACTTCWDSFRALNEGAAGGP